MGAGMKMLWLQNRMTLAIAPPGIEKNLKHNKPGYKYKYSPMTSVDNRETPMTDGKRWQTMFGSAKVGSYRAFNLKMAKSMAQNTICTCVFREKNSNFENIPKSTPGEGSTEYI